MKRKLLSMLLVLAMVLAIFPVSAFAAETNGDFAYEIVKDNGASYAVIVQYQGSEVHVNIPETLGGYPVAAIDDGAFYGSEIQTVNIPENIEYVGRQAFMYCKDLTDVYFGGYAVELDEEAFASCTSLEYIQVPYTGVLKENLFRGCHNLSAVYITDGNTEIEEGAFAYCEGLEYIYIPASMEIIYTKDFEDLDDVVIQGIPGYKHLGTAQKFAEKMGFTFESVEYPEGEDAVFSDVNGQHYYSLPVLWAATTGVTLGKGGGKFCPADACTRGQMITFIWRFCGSPEPNPNKLHNFTDVAENSYCYKAIQWGYQMGIIKGITDSEFRPNATVTRAMAVTMLHRLDDTPASSGVNKFTDLKQNAYYVDAILWAQEAGIAQGYGDGTFRPGEACTRGMIVTFMYRNLYELYHSYDPNDGNFVA